MEALNINKLKLAASQKKLGKSFWLNFLSQDDTKTSIQFDHIKETDLVEYSTINYVFSPSINNYLNKQYNGKESGIFIFLTSSISILLSRYSNNNVLIGTTIFNINNINPINTIIPLLFDLNSNGTFPKLLEHIKTITYTCFKNQNFPIEMLKEELGLKNDDKY